MTHRGRFVWPRHKGRKNRRNRPGAFTRPESAEPPKDPYEAMARDIVARGLASPKILDPGRVPS